MFSSAGKLCIIHSVSFCILFCTFKTCTIEVAGDCAATNFCFLANAQHAGKLTCYMCTYDAKSDLDDKLLCVHAPQNITGVNTIQCDTDRLCHTFRQDNLKLNRLESFSRSCLANSTAVYDNCADDPLWRTCNSYCDQDRCNNRDGSLNAAPLNTAGFMHLLFIIPLSAMWFMS